MNAFQRSKPSAAMIVAVLALALAMVGTAVAGPDGLTRAVTKSKVKKIAKKQANKAIDARAPGLSVASAVTGAPRAYALINEDGTVSPASPSREIASANITTPALGFFCFDLAFAPATAAANEADVGINDGVMAFTFVTADYQQCPATAEAEVTHLDTSSGYSNDAFYIQFHG